MEDKFNEIINETFDRLFGNKKEKFSLTEREKEINEFLSELKKLWMTCPKQRFTQMLFNYTKMGTPIDKAAGPSVGLKDFFYYEDKLILEEIKKSTKENIDKK